MIETLSLLLSEVAKTRQPKWMWTRKLGSLAQVQVGTSCFSEFFSHSVSMLVVIFTINWEVYLLCLIILCLPFGYLWFSKKNNKLNGLTADSSRIPSLMSLPDETSCCLVGPTGEVWTPQLSFLLWFYNCRTSCLNLSSMWCYCVNTLPVSWIDY